MDAVEVVSWVDDLLIMTPDNAAVLKDLQSRFKKLKDVGEPTYYLGGDFKREEGVEKVLTLGSKTYVKRMLDQYEKLFGGPPAMKNDPLPSRDHPELDVSDLCDDKGRALYQSLIGMLQWVVIGIPRSRALLRPLPMVQSSWQRGLQPSMSST